MARSRRPAGAVAAAIQRAMVVLALVMMCTALLFVAQAQEILDDLPTVIATWQVLEPTHVLPAGVDPTTIPVGPSGGPRGRCDPVFAFSAADNGVGSATATAILYGGQSADGSTTDAWSLDLAQDPPVWTYLPPSTASGSTEPAARLGALFEYLPTFHQLVMFGGQATDYFDDVHALNTLTGEWTTIQSASANGHTPGQPFARGWSSFKRTTLEAQVDLQAGTQTYELIMYGGAGDSYGVNTPYDQDQDDLWSYTYMYNTTTQKYTGVWTELEARVCQPTAQIKTCPDGHTLAARYPALNESFLTLARTIGNVTYRPAELVDLLSSLRATALEINTTAQTVLGEWLAAPTSQRVDVDDSQCTLSDCFATEPDPSQYGVDAGVAHPPRMEGYRASLYLDSLVFFGGYTCLDHGVQFIGGAGCYVSDVWFLNLTTRAWSVLTMPQIPSDQAGLYPNEVTQASIWPSPRAYHSQVIYNDRLYIYGGGFKSDSTNGGTMTYFNDLNVLDLATRKWIYTDVHGTTPTPAWSHAMVLSGDSAYLFGGCTDDAFSDATYRLRFDVKVLPANIYLSGPGVDDTTNSTRAGTPTYFIIETREILPVLAAHTAQAKAGARRAKNAGATAVRRSIAPVTQSKYAGDMPTSSEYAAHRRPRAAAAATTIGGGQADREVARRGSRDHRQAQSYSLQAPPRSTRGAQHDVSRRGRSLLLHSDDPAAHGFGALLPYGTAQTFLVQFINEERILTRAQVTELGGGRYNVTYTLRRGYMFQLYVKLDGTVLVTPKPLTVYNEPQVPNGAGGVVVTATPAIKGDPLTIRVQLLDALGNYIHTGGDVRGAILAGTDGTVAPTAAHTLTIEMYILSSEDAADTGRLVGDSAQRLRGVIDHSDGTYSLSFLVPDTHAADGSSFDYYALQLVWDGVPVAGGKSTSSAVDSSPMPVPLRAYDQSVLSPKLITVGYVLTSLCMAVILGYMVVLSFHSEARVVKASSYFFLMTLCTGVLLCFIAAFLLSVTTDDSCRAYPLVLGFGYNLLIGSLFVKSQRIMSIFTTKRLQVQNLGNLRTGAPILLLLGAELIFSIAWLASSPLKRVGIPNTNNPYQTYEHCDGPGKNGWVAFTIVEKACLMIYGIYLATKTRNVPRAYNESKLMAFSLYNITFSVLLGLLLIYLTQPNHDLDTPYITQVIVILWCCMCTASALILPRIYYLIYPPGADFFAAHVRKQSHGTSRKSGGMSKTGESSMGQSALATSSGARPTSSSIASVARPTAAAIAARPAAASVARPTTASVARPAPAAMRNPTMTSSTAAASTSAGQDVELQPMPSVNPIVLATEDSSSSVVRPTSPSVASPVGGVLLPRRVSLHDLNLHLPSVLDVAALAEQGMEEHVAEESRRGSLLVSNRGGGLLGPGMASDDPTPPDTPEDREPQEEQQETATQQQVQESQAIPYHPELSPPAPSEPHPTDAPAPASRPSTPLPAEAAEAEAAPAVAAAVAAAASSSLADEETLVASPVAPVSPFALRQQVHRPSVDYTQSGAIFPQPPPPSHGPDSESDEESSESDDD